MTRNEAEAPDALADKLAGIIDRALEERLTAETVTDEQIRAAYQVGVVSYDLLEFATFVAWRQGPNNAYYRGRCAEADQHRAEHEHPGPSAMPGSREQRSRAKRVHRQLLHDVRRTHRRQRGVPMLTGATITDGQIRELRTVAIDHAVTVICKQALRELPCNACSIRQRRGFDGQCPSCANERELARTRCAVMINEAFAAGTDADADAVWKLGCEEGVHGNPDMMHVGTVAKNTHGDFTLVEQAFARASCAEILAGRAKAVG